MAIAPSLGSPPSARNNGETLYTTDSALFDQKGVRYSFDSSKALALANEILWNANYPYQLVVLDATQELGMDLSSDSGDQSRPAVSYGIHNNLIFTLPVNPESLQNSTPFAIGVHATLGGVVEQHGGAPFRTITFSGTFGVVADRPSAGDLQSGRLGGGLGVVSGIAAGTMQAVRNLATTATSLGIGEKYTANLSGDTPGTQEGDILTGTTGYFQFKALQQFLESYVEAKKTSGGRGLRLALFVWKESAAYLVTPQMFDVQRTAASPFEYRYSLRFQAWRRINPNDVVMRPSSFTHPPMSASSGFSLAKTYAVISNATRTAQAVTNTLKAVRADAAKVVNTMRQVALFCSALGGIARTALSLPSSIRRDFEAAVRESWDIIAGSFNNLDPKVKRKVTVVSAEVAAVQSGIATDTPTLRAVLTDDEEADFHDLIRPDSLNLSAAARLALNEHIEETLTLTSDDFREAADAVFSLIDDYSDVVGLNNAAYDKVKGRTPKVKLRDATLDDFRALHTLGAAASAIQSLVVNTPARVPITTVEYVAGLANANGIAMRVPRSKFAVPFPYGSTLEVLAQQYLGDSARWMEIAELNDLRAPYVDETGMEQKLATNGTGNLVNLTDASTLTLGQYVRIWSDTVFSEKRRVLAIRPLSPTQWQVTLDGVGDLAKFKLVDNASILWYRVGTVNSQQVIYIPSESPSNPDIAKYVPEEQDFNRILSLGDIDGMLTDTGDLVVTPDGDWPMVFGFAYLVQWARVALNTPIQSMPLHPDFGIDAQVGQSIADSSAQDILKSVQSVFRFNPSFTGVSAALVQRNGSTTQVSLEVGVRGVDALLPLSFDVKS